MTTFIDPFNPGLETAPPDPDETQEGPPPPPDLEPEPDPAAPYGRNPDGKPYKHDAATRAAMGERLAAGRRAAKDAAASGRRKAPSAPGAAKSRAGTTKAPAGPNYRPAATTVLLIPAAVVTVLGKVLGGQRGAPLGRAFLADAVTITEAAPTLADAAHDWALEDDRVAAILERIGKVSPAGAFLAAAMVPALQMLHNHRIIPPVPEFGVVHIDQLIGPPPPREGVPVDVPDPGPDS